MNLPVALTTLIAILAIFITKIASAAPTIDVDFEHMTPNQPIMVSVPVAGQFPITNADGMTVASNVTMNVASNFHSYSNNVPFGSGNVAVIDKINGTNTSSVVSFEMYPTDKFTNGIISLNFDLMMDNDPTLTGNFFIGVRNSGYYTISSLSLNSGGGLTLVGYNSPGSSSGSTNIGSISKATQYNIEMRLDFSNGMTQVYLDGTAMGDSMPFATNTNGGAIGVSFSPGSTAIGRWAIDNVTMEQIPEPSSLALILLAGSSLFLQKRKRRC